MCTYWGLWWGTCPKLFRSAVSPRTSATRWRRRLKQGLSLTGYVRRELEYLAKRPHVVRDNAAVVRQTQAVVGGRVDRDMILSTLHEGRHA